eukprot:2425262-Lingulodinium_polyedra.AAC.1
MGGSQTGGQWAMPCCGKTWEWSICGGARVFSLLQGGGRWLLGFIGRSAGKDRDTEVDNHINFFRVCTLTRELHGRELAHEGILAAIEAVST